MLCVYVYYICTYIKGKKAVLVDTVCKGIQESIPIYNSNISSNIMMNNYNNYYPGLTSQQYNNNHAMQSSLMHQQLIQQQQQLMTNQQQYSNITQHYSQLVKHPNFTQGRSPFYQVEKRCCVMPVFQQKRIQFRISLTQDDVRRIKNLNELKENNGSTTSENIELYKRALHLRLFNVSTHEHQSWNTSNCEVIINNRKINIDKRNNKAGTKEKGFHIVKPLDITLNANSTMDFEITSNSNFGGVAVIEIVKQFSVEQIAKRVIERCKSIETKDKKCGICNITKDLLRCSRCKSVWYCGTKHQAKDWPFHQTICTPAENKPKLKNIAFENNDDDVVCGDVKISLRCPLSIIRINIPIRGSNCNHPQCIDLNSFLQYSHQFGNWQCPVCLKALKYDELVIDDKFQRILNETMNNEDVDQIRLAPDGSYKMITLQEQKDNDNKISNSNNNSKKRPNNNDDSGISNPKKKQKITNNNSTNDSNNNSNSNNNTNDDNISNPEDEMGQTMHDPIVLD